MAVEKIDMELTYAPYIDAPPITRDQMYAQSCSNDKVTLDSWRETWKSQYKINHDRFGSFWEHSCGQFHNLFHQRPCIVAGSGPSLKRNAEQLKERNGIPLISCLHNFAYFEDIGVTPEFYLTLDAGPIVLDEVWNGGKEKNPDYYWERTKGKKLLASTVTKPDLFDKWQGEVYFYQPVIPEQAILEYNESIEKFNICFSTGGNALGACVYAAKVLMGANPIIYVGANFAFDYTKKFHPWDSQYDKMGNVLRAFDCFGNSCWTWQSYFNFKTWFDWLAMTVPGIYINCTEGGLMGAYPDGNIRAVTQMNLANVIAMYGLSNVATVSTPDGIKKINMADIYANKDGAPRFTMY